MVHMGSVSPSTGKQRNSSVGTGRASTSNLSSAPLGSNKSPGFCIEQISQGNKTKPSTMHTWGQTAGLCLRHTVLRICACQELIIKMLPLGQGQCRKFCIAPFSVYVVSLSQLIGQIWPLAVLCPNRWPCSVVANDGSADDVGLCHLSGSFLTGQKLCFKWVLLYPGHSQAQLRDNEDSGVVVYAYNPRTRAVKAAGSLY